MPVNQAGITSTITVKLANNTITSMPSSRPVTLKSTTRSVTNIRDLADVFEGTPEEGEALVYDAVANKYVTRKIDATDIELNNINGGTF